MPTFFPWFSCGWLQKKMNMLNFELDEKFRAKWIDIKEN
jgi:hypothetical protein